MKPEMWDAAFLQRRYIRAPWSIALDNLTVGNRGFSLRSRRLLEALQDLRIEVALNEDQEICGRFRELLEREHRIRFGTSALARSFSFEIDPSHVLRVDPPSAFMVFSTFFLSNPNPNS